MPWRTASKSETLNIKINNLKLHLKFKVYQFLVSLKIDKNQSCITLLSLSPQPPPPGPPPPQREEITITIFLQLI